VRTFEVLVVCTGNVCRSPAAELLLAAALGPHSRVRVRSAGTNAPVGVPADDHVRRLLASVGIDGGNHRSRQVTERDAERSDLILTLTRDQRSRIARLTPSALRRIFILREFAQYAAAVPVAELWASAARPSPDARLAALVELAPRFRRPSAAPDIDDPFGAGEDVHRRVFSEIAQAIDTIAAAVHADPEHIDPRLDGRGAP